MNPYYLGIDIGGTKTTVGLFDADCGLVKAHTVPTQPQDGCPRLVERIRDVYDTLLTETGLPAGAIRAAGVASPGPLDLDKGTIVHIPTMGFKNEPLVAYLKQALALPVYLENDTNAAALCESVFGQGKDCRVVVYITISTGVGCGIAIDRKILDGGAFAAGEVGHLKVVRGGRPCPCGGEGCLEAYASGTSIAAIASELRGEAIDTKTVFALARQGDVAMRRVVDEAADHLGFAIGAVYQMIDPDIIVLGGSVTKDYAVFQHELETACARYMEPIPGRKLNLAVSQYDGDQVVIGAAYYGITRWQQEQHA